MKEFIICEAYGSQYHDMKITHLWVTEDPEVRDSRFSWNVGKQLPYNT
jgi:hypothetical protein